MKHLIFTSGQSCLDRIEQINNLLRPTWIDGVTQNYANPQKHPTEELWALVIEPRYEYAFTEAELSEAVELTEDWRPNGMTGLYIDAHYDVNSLEIEQEKI